jgi:hypothetical protein
MNYLLFILLPRLVFAYIPGPIVSGTATERIEYALIVTFNPPTVVNQSGSWLTFVSRAGPGDFIWTMAGFSGIPTCIMTNAQINSLNNNTAATVTSSTAVHTQVYSGGSADVTTCLTCMGPR